MCPHGDVLTVEHGWVPIQDVNIGDAVYSVDPDGRLVESIVDQVHAAPWSGDMVHVRARNAHGDDPNHRVAKLRAFGRASTLTRAFAPSSRWSSSDDLPGQIPSYAPWSGQACRWVLSDHPTSNGHVR